MKLVHYLLGVIIIVGAIYFYQNQSTTPSGYVAGGIDTTDLGEGLALCDNPEFYSTCMELAPSANYETSTAAMQCIIAAKKQCYASYAIQENDLTVCELSSVNLDFAEPGEMRAGCYSQIGVISKDKSVCGMIDTSTPAAEKEHLYCTMYSG